MDDYYWNLTRVFFGVSSVWAILGIICNSFILLATIRTRTLRSTYNILIAVCAASDVLHQVGNLFQLPMLLNIYVEMDSQRCNLIMLLPAMGIAVGCTSILCTGLDRMISVIYPMSYRTLNKRTYHLILASIICGYCAYFCFLIIYFHQPRRVICQMIIPFLGSAAPFFNYGNFAINTLSAGVYFAIWNGLRSRTDSVAMHRIIKSLFIVVAVDLGGWFLTPGIVIVLGFLNLERKLTSVVKEFIENPSHYSAWTYFARIFIQFALSVKFFIYYYMSSEYRSAFNVVLFKSTRIGSQRSIAFHVSAI